MEKENTVRVSVVISLSASDKKNETSSVACLAKFTSRRQLEATAEKSSMCELQESSTGVQLIAKTKQMTYTSERQSQPKYSKNFIGVRDKKAGTMKIYELRCFQMAPEVAPMVVNSDVSELEVSTIDLKKRFGSVQTQRLISRTQNMFVKTEDMKEELAKVMDSLDMTDTFTPLCTNQESLAAIIPYRDEFATSVEDVYTLDSLMTQADWAALDEAVEIFYSEDIELKKLAKRFSTYVQNTYRQVEDDPDKLKLLLYSDFLLSLKKLDYRSLRKKDPLPPHIPDTICKSLLNGYTNESANGRVRPRWLVDKLVCYFLVSSMIVHNFSVNLTEMSTLLNMTIMRLRTHLKMIGAKEDNKKHIATLSMPLYKMPGKRMKKKPLS